MESAARAIAHRDFRLIAIDDVMGSSSRPQGVTRFTPDGISVGVRTQFFFAAVITREKSELLQYVQQFNRRVMTAQSYPFADIRRISNPQEASSYDAPMVDRSAREVAQPAATLHEPVRRGSATDVRRFLSTTPRNMRDEIGMTPLAWAAACGRSDIYDLLVFNEEVPRALADVGGSEDLY